MATIVCRKVSFAYDGTDHKVFNDLDLLIDTGWRTALVGSNGRGKTTLLRLIHGQLAPDRGSLERPVETRRFPVAVNEPSISAFEAAKDAAGAFRQWEREMSRLLEECQDELALERFGALQARFQEAGGYSIDANLEEELDSLDIGPALRERKFGTLSGGEQTRCLLAGLFARHAGFPLIDEPTNHLDRAGRARLANYLSDKPGFLIVSHDRAFLDGCVDHTIALNSETVEVHRGSVSTWRTNFRQRLARQKNANASLRKEISRLESASRERKGFAARRESDKSAHIDNGFIGARAARQMKRAIAIQNRADKSVELRRQALIDIERSYPLKFHKPSTQSTRSSIVVENLTVVRDNPLFAPISFHVRRGDRVAVTGPNGSGKTSLLELMAGESHPYLGAISCASRLNMIHVRQKPRWISGSLSSHLAADGVDETRFRQVMAALGVRGSILDRPIESMSPGQQKKIELARSFVLPSDLLLWDEPLNFLDIDAREAIQEAVLRDCPTLVFVEHDAAFVDQVATRSVELLPWSPSKQ